MSQKNLLASSATSLKRQPTNEKGELPRVVTDRSSRSAGASNLPRAPTDTVQVLYRTLSVRVENPVPKNKTDPAAAIRDIDAHLLRPDDVFARYSTHPSLGLEDSAVARKAQNGPKNAISAPPTNNIKKMLNYIFGGFNFLMWIAFIVTVLSYQPLGGDNPQVFNLGVAVLLFIVIVISAAFYAFVDWNANRIMKSIRSLVAEDATVIRNGERKVIAATDIVVGDLVVLTLGQRVPADLRLVEVSSDIRFDRSLLTGESEPLRGAVEPSDNNPLQTRNLALMSTFIVQGSGLGVCFAIGDNTVMGRIVALSSRNKEEQTPIQKEIWIFTMIISGLAAFLFGLSMLFWGVYTRTAYPGFANAPVAIINAIGCLTAFVPQGLPICVALSLAIIAKRMAKRSVLIKNLSTIETLGCMSVLCSDKTGTLTRAKMIVHNCGFLDTDFQTDDKEVFKVHANAVPGLKIVHTAARLCTDSQFLADSLHLPLVERKTTGDSTDAATLIFAEELGNTVKILDGHERVYRIPFNSKNKWMMTIVREKTGGKVTMFVKGAPDILMKMCSAVLQSNGETTALDSQARASLNETQTSWSAQGQRVLAICSKDLTNVSLPKDDDAIEKKAYAEMQGLTLTALLGIRDPPREDVKPAIEIMRKAGVRVFMVTGDFKLTAIAIGRQVGIITTSEVDGLTELRQRSNIYQGVKASEIKPKDDEPVRALAIVGDELQSMTDADWDLVLGQYTELIFARTTPEQKLNIVEMCKARGDNTLAVTGDGVNDAPALKAADIGIAMGAGSDVAKDAAAVILLNNDFASIPIAIENGRLVFDNLKKVILYLMPAGTYTEFMAVLANVFFGMQIPLSSFLQVVFSAVHDTLMAIGLMCEYSESDLMLRKPRNARTDRLTDWRFFIQVYFVIGLMMWPCAMGMFFLYFSSVGFGFYDLLFAYDAWGDGYKGFSLAQLNTFVNTGQCVYYVTMVIMQFGAILAIRNRRVSILQSNPFAGPRKNLVLGIGMLSSTILALIVLYGPALQYVFGTNPIPYQYWLYPFGFAAGILLVDELRKLAVRSYPKSFLAKIAW